MRRGRDRGARDRARARDPQAVARLPRPVGQAGRQVESFDWSQSYGPLNWPRTGQPVMQVRAAHPDYWKAENLDLFGGKGWVLGDVPGTQDPSARSAAPRAAGGRRRSRSRSAQMVTSQVIAAGSAGPPTHLVKPYVAGPSPGTWTRQRRARPRRQLLDHDLLAASQRTPSLRAREPHYPAELLPGYLTIYIPDAGAVRRAAPAGRVRAVRIDALRRLRSGAAPIPGRCCGPRRTRRRTRWRCGCAAESRRRSRTSARSSGYLLARLLVRREPAAGDVPARELPVPDPRGYCQQFAGAMALLLRMGGVPARVAVGFTTGHYDTATRQLDASPISTRTPGSRRGSRATAG